MNLTIELVMSAVMMTICTVVHGTGISAMDKIFRNANRDLGTLRLARREFGLMVPMALFLLVLHIIEIFIFAIFYLATGDSRDMHQAIYHSGLAYTTMGVIERRFTKWTVLSNFEGLAGLPDDRLVVRHFWPGIWTGSLPNSRSLGDRLATWGRGGNPGP